MANHRLPARAATPILSFVLLCGAALGAESDPALDGEPGDATDGINDGAYFLQLTEAALASTIASEAAAGRDLVDLEPYWDGAQVRFAAVFRPVPGEVHVLVDATTSEWQTWLGQMNALAGRYLDFEVDYFSGSKRYSGLFVEDGDDVPAAIHSTDDDAAFQAHLQQYLESGYSIVDFESYVEPGGAVRYGGIWAKDLDTPMTHLFYGLTAAERADLLAPLAGRPLDHERYWSPLHGEYRYALILGQVGSDNHGWALASDQSAATLASNHATYADADTYLIDLDVRADASPPRYMAIWGKARGSRAAVAPLFQPTNVEPLPGALQTAINTFLVGADLGLEARNLRTNQTLAFGAERPFYLASVAKTAIHVRLWQLFQSGHLDPAALAPYTLGQGTREPWFVDERSNDSPGIPRTGCESRPILECATSPGSPGFNACHFGQSFPLSRYDQAMMQVSDNAATSLLVDHDGFGLARDTTSLNEWLSGISGVAKGVGLVTSIHDVDRTILWQGQVMDYPAETSYFNVPPPLFEPYFRCADDRFGDLRDYLGLDPGEDLPAYDETVGHLRWNRMGLDSASPRAWTRFLELFAEDAFLTAANTDAAIAVMTEGSRLGSSASFPSGVATRTKGGSKGDPLQGTRTITEAGFFQLGPDTIAVSVFSNYGLWSDAQYNNQFGTLGLEILRGLSARLVECGAGSRGFSPSVTTPGGPLGVWCAVSNLGGGDAPPFDVAFRLSANTSITAADPVVGTVRVPGIPAGGSYLANLQTDLPAGFAPGTYYVAWEIDRELVDPGGWGEVGEFDETNAPHVGYVAEGALTVAPSAAIFDDDFEGGTLGAWSGQVP